MSRQIETLYGQLGGSLGVNQYCGPAYLGEGKDRLCVQLDASAADDPGFVLTRKDAAELIRILAAWLAGVDDEEEDT